MSLGNAQPLNENDVPGAPSWFVESFLPKYNELMNELSNLLERRLTFVANMHARVYTIKLTHDTTQAIDNPFGDIKPIGVIPIYAEGRSITAYKLAYTQRGKLDVTVSFDTSAAANVTLLFIGG